MTAHPKVMYGSLTGFNGVPDKKEKSSSAVNIPQCSLTGLTQTVNS